jgi:hypothetical protein
LDLKESAKGVFEQRGVYEIKIKLGYIHKFNISEQEIILI